MMKRKKMFSSSKKASNAFCLLAGALLSLSAAYGQRTIDSEKGNRESLSLKDRMYYGGGFNLRVNVGSTVAHTPSSINVQGIGFGPNAIAGYMLTPRFSTGIGLLWLRISYSYEYSYEYNPFKDPFFEDGITHQYGGLLFARYYFTKRLFVYSEFGLSNADVSHSDDKRGAVFSMPLGVGLKIQKRPEEGFFTLSLMYDAVHNAREGGNVHGAPWNFRFGFFTR